MTLCAVSVVLPGIYPELADDYILEPAQSDMVKLFEALDSNKKSITALLKGKYDMMGKICAQMRLRSLSRIPLSQKQIDDYKRFCKTYSKQSAGLLKTLEDIDRRMTLKRAQSAILGEKAEFGPAALEIRGIIQCQCRAIGQLYNILKMANKQLEALANTKELPLKF